MRNTGISRSEPGRTGCAGRIGVIVRTSLACGLPCEFEKQTHRDTCPIAGTKKRIGHFFVPGVFFQQPNLETPLSVCLASHPWANRMFYAHGCETRHTDVLDPRGNGATALIALEDGRDGNKTINALNHQNHAITFNSEHPSHFPSRNRCWSREEKSDRISFGGTISPPALHHTILLQVVDSNTVPVA